MYKTELQERSPLASRETSPRRSTSRGTSPRRSTSRGTSPSRRPMRETSPRRSTSRGTSPSRNQKWTPNWDGFPKPSASNMSKYDSEGHHEMHSKYGKHNGMRHWTANSHDGHHYGDRHHGMYGKHWLTNSHGDKQHSDDEDDLSWIEERNGGMRNWSANGGRSTSSNARGEQDDMSSSPRAQKRRVVWKPTRAVPTTHCRTDSYEWSPCGERSRSMHHHYEEPHRQHNEKIVHEHVDALTYRDGRYFDKTVHRHHDMIEAKHNTKEAHRHSDKELHKAVEDYNKLARKRGYKTVSAASLSKARQ